MLNCCSTNYDTQAGDTAGQINDLKRLVWHSNGMEGQLCRVSYCIGTDPASVKLYDV